MHSLILAMKCTAVKLCMYTRSSAMNLMLLLRIVRSIMAQTRTIQHKLGR